MPSTASVVDVIDRIENATPLDAAIGVVRRVVDTVIGPQTVRDALHGVWLGHPLHPMLTDIPIGTWTAAAILDLMPGNDAAAATLIRVGCVAAVPTALSGWADWSELHEQQQRVGLVHAAGVAVAVACYSASLAARSHGRSGPGRAWAMAGYAATSVTGYLGGHLAFRQAAGVNHTEHVPHLFPTGWQQVCDLTDLPDGELSHRDVAGTDLVLMRRGGHVDALADTCSHLSASLAEGDFTVVEGQGCVVCPWHGSTFRLSDGGVVHGPATAPQPRFDVRISGSTIEVMLPGAG